MLFSTEIPLIPFIPRKGYRIGGIYLFIFPFCSDVISVICGNQTSESVIRIWNLSSDHGLLSLLEVSSDGANVGFWSSMQASDRFNINSQLEHLQAKYVGTGHADLNRLLVFLFLWSFDLILLRIVVCNPHFISLCVQWMGCEHSAW